MLKIITQSLPVRFQIQKSLKYFLFSSLLLASSSPCFAYGVGDVTFDLIKEDNYGRQMDYYIMAYSSYYYLTTRMKYPKTSSFIYSTAGVFLYDLVADQVYYRTAGIASTYLSVSLHF